MNKLLVVLLLLGSFSSYAALLRCEVIGDNGSYGYNRQTGITELVKGECRISKFDGILHTDPLISFEIVGKGLGARWAMIEGFLLTCPTARAKNLKKVPFYGVKVSAGALVGASAGVFVNKRGGTCVLTGAQFNSLGIGVSGVKLRFK
ncbi:MAG: hypothetical protein N4A33_08490 [Bacteriovoracaceae bacterium]|jgi:hypothetical protein|nr:hypothetical protein [Bacteriovoracaceae bacterium]